MIKPLIKKTYRSVKFLLPTRARAEIEGYASYRRDRRQSMPSAGANGAKGPGTSTAAQPKSYQAPYWQRREPAEVDAPPIRLGVIGAGNYAQHHLKALTALKNVSVQAILSTGAPRVQSVVQQYNIATAYTDTDAFLQEQVDGYVVVASAQVLQAKALACLATGKPVLMEKPPGISAAETLELVEQANRHNTFGMVCFNRRFYSVLEHGLADLANWGPVRGLMLEIPQQITGERQSARLSAWDYDNFFVRNSIHGVDLARYILGEPVRVHSLASPNSQLRNAGASFATILEYDRGVVATITDLWDTPQKWRVKVVAEKGWLELEPFEVGWVTPPSGTKTPISADPIDREYRAGVYAQDLCFVRALRTGTRPALPASLLPDAYKTMVLIEKIQASTIRAAQ